MILTKLGLENSGAFRAMVLSDLSNGLNVILGDTGSGKSTLRHGIAAIFYDDLGPAQTNDRTWDARPSCEAWVAIGGEPFHIRRAAGERPSGAESLIATTAGATTAGATTAGATAGWPTVRWVGNWAN